MILLVALDMPLRRVFDYLPPAQPGAASRPKPRAGVRVRVPFGRRQLIGILVGVADDSPIPADKLKPIVGILDDEPVFDAVTFELLRWAADYYHHPIGEVFAAALPVSLREGQPTREAIERWDLTPAGRQELAAPSDRRAPRQRALLQWLKSRGSQKIDEISIKFNADLVHAAAARGWIAATEMPAAHLAGDSDTGNKLDGGAYADSAESVGSADYALTAAQSTALAAIVGSLSRFAAILLYGITGSGKTEVYLRAIERAIAGGGQALVLVPEIALTPQLVDRFQQRFHSGLAVLHSGLAGTQRRDAWRMAHNGEARIVIGTRSAVFASLPNLALIVVDEEHDPSYKQQEGFRYSARDLAVLRAQRAAVPIVLGSATPSLETLENVAQGRYQRISLPERAGGATPPKMTLVDLRRHAADQGISQPAMQAISEHLGAGGQVIVFLNRRGYAPTLFCNACGWVAPCAHCDARMTLHRSARQLRCHHCGAQEPVPLICGSCGHALLPVGQGTERIEETLQRLFPTAPLARLDRDTAGLRTGVESVLARMHSGEARILVGTQMLTKGHHFPQVSLVVILDADQGLFASDYRATERLAQTIIQVAGRAGRDARAGSVLIQTEYPEHPLLNLLITSGYEAFAAGALAERREANWPPYSRLALLRAEARDAKRLNAFLTAAADIASSNSTVKVLGPASALLARRADHFRAHLLIEASGRIALQRFLDDWLTRIEALRLPPGLRWSIDVDPSEVD
ncbi:MAG TPA: primosomal protein N' [Steroidobacteraceae bacterium]|nr:primosomal protein N' [Steroidobacteraceae bacterium]